MLHEITVKNDVEIISFFPQNACCQEERQKMLTSMWRVNILCIPYQSKLILLFWNQCKDSSKIQNVTLI